MSSTRPLNHRELRFVDAYLLSGNATDAFIKAGYSKSGAPNNASRLMGKDSIREAIERGQSAIRRKNTKTGDDVIAALCRIAFGDMSKFMRINANGEPVIDLSNCTPEDLNLIAEITVDTYLEGRGEDARKVKKIKIKPYSRMEALHKLAMHFGLLTAKGPREGIDRMAEMMKELQERGSALPVRVTGPLGSGPKPWKN